MRFLETFLETRKMSKNEPNLRRFLKKFYGNNLFFPNCNSEHYALIFIFPFFYVFFPKSCSGFHFWTFLKCPFLRISENSSNKVFFSY